MNVRTYRRANCESDHFLVCMTFKSRILTKGTLGKHRPGKIQKIQIDKLKILEMLEQYQRGLAEELEKQEANWSEESAIEEDWRNIKSAILEAGERILGPKERGRRSE